MALMSSQAKLVREERQLRFWLWIAAVLFALEAAIYIPAVFGGPATTSPYAINSVAKDVVFAALTAAAAADLARRARLIWLVILGHVVIVVLLLVVILTGDTSFAFPPPRWLAHLIPALDVPPGSRALVWLIGAAVVAALLAWLLHRALRARYRLRYLWPAEHAALAAVAQAILSEPVIAPEQIATAVDHYWASLDIGYKRRLRLALWVTWLLPLLFLRPPLPVMEAGARRRFIERCFVIDVASRAQLGPLRTTVQSAFRFAMQLVYLGYYRNRRTDALTGYVPFSARGHPIGPHRPAPDLRVRPIPPARSGEQRAEVVVVGTGAGGSIVARELAKRGREVLMLERGRYVKPSDFVEDEAVQYARLYSDGALQLSRDFSFQVLQGMCVGGSTAVNNGVCFEIPDEVLNRWNTEHNAGLDVSALRQSFGEVRGLIHATEQLRVRANPVAARIRGQGLEPVTANLEGCLGCGYCNIGCAFNRKLSMLVGVLPDTQRETDVRRERQPDFHGRLDLLAGCEVSKVRQRGGRATGVSCCLRLPSGRSRNLEVRADTVVLAAGAIHSSRILMASGIGNSRVGRGLAANLGSHMTGYWPGEDPLNTFDGLQMSHYLDGSGSPSGFRIETWFNPVMSQALVMPGWLEDHQRNMRRYNRLACLGVIAGSTSNGNHVLRRRDWLSGAEIAFTPSDDDLETLLEGLRAAGKLMLRAGARCVMPATFRYHEFRFPEELARLSIDDLVKDASDISVNTGHPQGGNAVSSDSSRGVVDPNLRVHGCENLFVCDASTFPTAITVNPQLTVMALAHYGAQFIP
jgi:choline dehydrogenase-like flavoprotein